MRFLLCFFLCGSGGRLRWSVEVSVSCGCIWWVFLVSVFDV